MGRRGTKPQPTALKILAGAQPCRINQNPATPPEGTPEPPDYVRLEASGRSLEFWNEFAATLSSMGILSVLDRHSFALLCESYALWRVEPNNLKVRDEFRKLLAEFGLTPSSRSVFNALPPGQVVNDLDSFLAEAK